ncbi:hypothetical protein, partial [Streptomyces tendae]
LQHHSSKFLGALGQVGVGRDQQAHVVQSNRQVKLCSLSWTVLPVEFTVGSIATEPCEKPSERHTTS